MLQAIPVYERARPILAAVPEVDEAKADPGILRGESLQIPLAIDRLA